MRLVEATNHESFTSNLGNFYTDYSYGPEIQSISYFLKSHVEHYFPY